MNNTFNTEYKDYKDHVCIMISTDNMIFNERSAVRARMIEYAKSYKEMHIIVFSKIKFISENCTIYSTNSFSKFNYIKNAYKIGKKILKNVDKSEKLLISCQDPFETGLAGKKIASLRNNSELLLQIHTDLFSPYFTSNKIGFKNAVLNRIRLFISKFTLSHAQVIRVVSIKIAESLVLQGIAKDKIIVKPIRVDENTIKNSLPSFNLHEKFPQFKKIILMVSRLESEKNIEMAIEAMKIVNSKINDAGLIIVGSGRSINKLKKITNKLDLNQKVIFEGWQTDTISYYRGCDIVLVTSWYEGYGMVIKEAQIVGKKIVSTDVGIAREVGALIAEYTPDSIAQKILEVLV